MHLRAVDIYGTSVPDNAVKGVVGCVVGSTDDTGVVAADPGIISLPAGDAGEIALG